MSPQTMKRKKWSEAEEQTLLSKYSELSQSGALSKLKTREKKFKPIAEHVNAVHHLRDPASFPFRWSWRDVSIKVQNMRHQYLGVKQKIRASDGDFNWEDGEIHWENFLKYKEVFGDIELSDASAAAAASDKSLGLEDILAGTDEEEDEEGSFEEDDDEEEEEDENGLGLAGDRVVEINCVKEGKEISGITEPFDGESFKKKKKKRRSSLRTAGYKVLELRDLSRTREEKRRRRDGIREEEATAGEQARSDREITREMRLQEREVEIQHREATFEETWVAGAKRDLERWRWLRRRLEEERRERMKAEEKRAEEEMAWRERAVEMQMEHEKQMMQLQAEACHNQLQLLGAMARLFCQFFGSPAGDGLGPIPSQFMPGSQHPVVGGGLGDEGEKPDSTSPSEFL